MKKIAVILLALILLYNWVGYQLLVRYIERHEDRLMEARLDSNEYDENDLVEIKIPLNLPYLSDWSGFKRVDGEIDLNGKHYKYVKRRVYNDSLILLCLPNRARQKLGEATSNYFGQVNGLEPASRHQQKGAEAFFKILPAAYPSEENWSMRLFCAVKQPFCMRYLLTFPVCCLAGPDQPPEHLSA